MVADLCKTIMNTYAEALGLHGKIIWDRYTVNEEGALYEKLEIIATSIYGIPQSENNVKVKKWVATVKNAIWSQRKYNYDDLIMGLVFVAHVPKTGLNPISNAQYETDFTVHILFRIKKCFKNNFEYCCSVFVDEHGRVYEDWFDYLNNNTLPNGILVAPKMGIYSFDDNNQVLLDYKQKNLNEFSLGQKIIGVGALGITSFLLPPVGLFVGGILGPICMGNGIKTLVNRAKHEQTLIPREMEAFQAWTDILIGVGGTTFMALRPIKFISNGKNVASLLRDATISNINGVRSIVLDQVNASNIYATCRFLFVLTNKIYHKLTINDNNHNDVIMEINRDLVRVSSMVDGIHVIRPISYISYTPTDNPNSQMGSIENDMFTNIHIQQRKSFILNINNMKNLLLKILEEYSSEIANWLYEISLSFVEFVITNTCNAILIFLDEVLLRSKIEFSGEMRKFFPSMGDNFKDMALSTILQSISENVIKERLNNFFKFLKTYDNTNPKNCEICKGQYIIYNG